MNLFNKPIILDAQFNGNDFKLMKYGRIFKQNELNCSNSPKKKNEEEIQF